MTEQSDTYIFPIFENAPTETVSDAIDRDEFSKRLQAGSIRGEIKRNLELPSAFSISQTLQKYFSIDEQRVAFVIEDIKVIRSMSGKTPDQYQAVFKVLDTPNGKALKQHIKNSAVMKREPLKVVPRTLQYGDGTMQIITFDVTCLNLPENMTQVLDNGGHLHVDEHNTISALTSGDLTKFL